MQVGLFVCFKTLQNFTRLFSLLPSYRIIELPNYRIPSYRCRSSRGWGKIRLNGGLLSQERVGLGSLLGDDAPLPTGAGGEEEMGAKATQAHRGTVRSAPGA